jgi:hypothetical protein
MMLLKSCPFCGGSAELTFKVPVYGGGGCEIRCISCRARVNDFGFSEHLYDEEKGTLSTPVTIESISACINRAVNAWGRRAKE